MLRPAPSFAMRNELLLRAPCAALTAQKPAIHHRSSRLWGSVRAAAAATAQAYEFKRMQAHKQKLPL